MMDENDVMDCVASEREDDDCLRIDELSSRNIFGPVCVLSLPVSRFSSSPETVKACVVAGAFSEFASLSAISGSINFSDAGAEKSNG